ncbi:MAG: hypothetical protein SFY69_06380 [Planctomycetota bacterium]|nr:hypothetical protein [Planctomycetota bacterium]
MSAPPRPIDKAPDQPAPAGSAAPPGGVRGTGPGAVPDAPIGRLPLLVGAVACACLLAMPLGFFAAGIVGEKSGGTSPSHSAMLGAFAACAGAVVGLFVLAPRAMRGPSRLGVAIVVASMVRLGVAGLLGYTLWINLRPERTPFVVALIAAVFLITAAEATWAVLALRRHGSGIPPNNAP